MTNFFKDKEILITGGTGSLGKALTALLFDKYKPKGVRILSRDELKQFEMKNEFNQKYPDAPIAFLIGDVRDRKRLELATKGVDILIHAAALKQIPSCETNPLEAINTNIIGAQNVVYAALENKIEKVLAISTDKACYPINLYGAAKLCAEKLFLKSHIYGGSKSPKFACVRYGNVLGSRGSIVPLFRKQYEEIGKITITDERMTRFWITLKQVANFILQSISEMLGNEIFIPKMPSCKVRDLAKIVAPDASIEIIGIRQGEKLHETLICAEEARIEYDDHYVIYQGHMSADGSYTSDENEWWLSEEELKEMIG